MIERGEVTNHLEQAAFVFDGVTPVPRDASGGAGLCARWQAGFNADGMFEALDLTLGWDGEGSGPAAPTLALVLAHLDNTYWIPHFRLLHEVTAPAPAGPAPVSPAPPGIGALQGLLIIEDIVGQAAPSIGIEPDEMRYLNLYRPGQSTPDGRKVHHPEHLDEIWAQTLLFSDFPTRMTGINAFNREHTDRKRGLAITPMKRAVGGHAALLYGCAVAEVEVEGASGTYVIRRVDLMQEGGSTQAEPDAARQVHDGFRAGMGWLMAGGDAASTSEFELNIEVLPQAADPQIDASTLAEAPMLLAFAVREAARQAAASFGPYSTSVALASPATPQAIHRALDSARGQ